MSDGICDFTLISRFTSIEEIAAYIAKNGGDSSVLTRKAISIISDLLYVQHGSGWHYDRGSVSWVLIRNGRERAVRRRRKAGGSCE